MTGESKTAWDAVPVGAVVQEKWGGRLWTSWRVSKLHGCFIVDEGKWRGVGRYSGGGIHGAWSWVDSSATTDFVVVGMIDLTLTDKEIHAAYNRLIRSSCRT